ncbi:OmpA family protein [Paenibacillus sp. IB182496]|uniref:OmpA family protein n=1 Tax=Paenibacillus sabuli TaxID=2772509 RepID=A0A927BZ02_9BACL|nr:flagellar motor protein MotB [Paenibacillus sabuli]MBD2848481.1 OmpA family protein [Paenibacillus sabuli]
MRRRRRTGARQSADKQERWLITYSDLITLLLIFFVVLYAMSQLDARKYETLAQSLQFEFRYAGTPLEGGAGVLDGQPASRSNDAAQPEREVTAEAAAQVQERELQDLLRIIEDYIRAQQLEQQITVADTPRGIAIRLNDLFLFDLGRADLKQAAQPVLRKLASLFEQLPNTISIEGHTDNLPLQRGSSFQDNWELSAARALSVLRYYVDTAGLAPERFELAGYADTRPVASNADPEGRQQNRRVEITVLRPAQAK